MPFLAALDTAVCTALYLFSPIKKPPTFIWWLCVPYKKSGFSMLNTLVTSSYYWIIVKNDFLTSCNRNCLIIIAYFIIRRCLQRGRKSCKKNKRDQLLKIPDLKVGAGVDIVFENEINKRNAHYMRALVYDYKGGKIVVSQTSPPLNRHFINRRVAITFLASTDKRAARFGFTAQLVGLATDYTISANTTVEALIFKQLEKLQRMDFRLYFRVKPPSYSNINLFFKGERVNLIDISLGGAKFSYPSAHLFRHGDTVSFELIIDYAAFEVNARVRNLSRPHESSANNALQYVGVEFEVENKQLTAVLGKAIIAIERQMLSEGKIV